MKYDNERARVSSTASVGRRVNTSCTVQCFGHVMYSMAQVGKLEMTSPNAIALPRLHVVFWL